MSYLQIKEGAWQGLHSGDSLDNALVLDLDTFEVESASGAELGTMDLITPKDEILGARFMDQRGTLSCPSRKISYKRIDGTDIVHIGDRKFTFSHSCTGSFLRIKEDTLGMEVDLALGDAMQIWLPSDSYSRDEDAAPDDEELDNPEPDDYEDSCELQDYFDEECFTVCDCGFLYIFAVDNFVVGRYMIDLKLDYDGTSYSHRNFMSVFWDKRGNFLGAMGAPRENVDPPLLFRGQEDCYIEDEVYDAGLLDLPY